jgi:hypothetical protein
MEVEVYEEVLRRREKTGYVVIAYRRYQAFDSCPADNIREARKFARTYLTKMGADEVEIARLREAWDK